MSIASSAVTALPTMCAQGVVAKKRRTAARNSSESSTINTRSGEGVFFSVVFMAQIMRAILKIQNQGIPELGMLNT